MKEDTIYIGLRIRKARLDMGIKQAEFADALGLSRTSLTNIEKGRTRVTTVHLQNIAAVTGNSMDWFMPPTDVESESVQALTTITIPNNVLIQLENIPLSALNRFIEMYNHILNKSHDPN